MKGFFKTLAFGVIMVIFSVHAHAQINFTGSAHIQSPLTIFAPGGVNGVLTPPGLLATNLVDINSAPDIGGLKVTALDLIYTASALDVGKTFTVSWAVARQFNALSNTTINHVNQLDGSISYTGFNLFDISLRTITTGTDTDLTALHLGPLTSGTTFNASLTNPGYLQLPGPDRVIQFFSMQFQQTAVGGSVELILPSSAGSFIASVPEPETSALMLAGICSLGWLGRRRKLQFA